MSKWLSLSSEEQLEDIDQQSREGPGIAIYKHSTRCFVSSMARSRLEQHWDELPDGMPVYFVDILSHRAVSRAIAQHYQVRHESPQLLLIRHGQCIRHVSHEEVDPAALVEES